VFLTDLSVFQGKTTSKSMKFSSIDFLLLLVLTWHPVYQSNRLLTSNVPVKTNVFQSNIGQQKSSNSNRLNDGRSKSQLFQNILGLQPGQEFSFDFAKWRALQVSGLFENLTANTALDSSGNIFINVSGVETPSRTITPELTVIASRGIPQVLGGVSNYYVHMDVFVKYLKFVPHLVCAGCMQRQELSWHGRNGRIFCFKKGRN
jgi:hypothetical protein